MQKSLDTRPFVSAIFQLSFFISHFSFSCVTLALCVCAAADEGEPRFIDHSLLVAPEYPATWPSAPFPRFQITHQRTIGPDSAYNIDVLLIDGNTATQLDVPPHSVARPDLKRPKSGPLGLAYTDKIEAWQFGGEACVRQDGTEPQPRDHGGVDRGTVR